MGIRIRLKTTVPPKEARAWPTIIASNDRDAAMTVSRDFTFRLLIRGKA
jgi:hypothetical protein